MSDLENKKKLFYTIKEVALHFKVTATLLRYWESEFDIICPKKSAGGTRQYTKEDINAIALVYHLVKEKGMTLEGAKQRLSQKKSSEEKKMEVIRKLENIKKELMELSQGFELSE